jgi:hypothetical protein
MRGEDGKIEFLVSQVMLFCLMSLSLCGICLLILGSCESFGHWDSV